MINRTTRSMSLLAATAAIAAIAALVCAAVPARAQSNVSAPPEALMKRMLEATKTKSYDAFIAEGTDKLKAGLTKQMFEGVSNMIAPRLRQGYKTSYLGKLHQQGHAVYLWKLEFTDGKDDSLVKVAMDEGKVGGIWLQ